MKKVLLVILDGLGDLKIKELENKTPLEAANTKNLDFIKKNGTFGFLKPFQFKEEDYPTSEGTHIALFGYKDYFLKRGPYSAMGVNLPLNQGDIALRVNFATIKDGIIIDRRANRIKNTDTLIKALSNIEIDKIKFDIKKGDAHRAVLVLRGDHLKDNLSSNDPKKEGKAPLKIKGDQRTADALNAYIKKTHLLLNELEFNKKRAFPANYLLVRGAGQFKKVPSFKEKYGLSAVCVAGGALYKGIAKTLGMDIIEDPLFTADIDTDLEGKFKAVKKALNSHDFVFLHIKGTDVCSHDGKFYEKKAFIEKIDKYFKEFLNLKDLLMIITGDHATPCKLKEHSSDNVPILIHGIKKEIPLLKGEEFMEIVDKIIKNKYN